MAKIIKLIFNAMTVFHCFYKILHKTFNLFCKFPAQIHLNLWKRKEKQHCKLRLHLKKHVCNTFKYHYLSDRILFTYSMIRILLL